MALLQRSKPKPAPELQPVTADVRYQAAQAALDQARAALKDLDREVDRLHGATAFVELGEAEDKQKVLLDYAVRGLRVPTAEELAMRRVLLAGEVERKRAAMDGVLFELSRE